MSAESDFEKARINKIIDAEKKLFTDPEYSHIQEMLARGGQVRGEALPLDMQDALQIKDNQFFKLTKRGFDNFISEREDSFASNSGWRPDEDSARISLTAMNYSKGVGKGESGTKKEKSNILPGESVRSVRPSQNTFIRTTGNLPDWAMNEPGLIQTIPPAIRKPFEKSFSQEGKRELDIRRSMRKDEEALAAAGVAIETAKTPTAQKLAQVRGAVKLRQAIEDRKTKDAMMSQAIESGDFETFKRSIPITRNADGEVTIRFTPSVLELSKTEKGKAAIKQAQRDFMSEAKAGESLRNELEREAEKVESGKDEPKESGLRFLEKFGFGKKPAPAVVPVPETGEAVDVGAKPQKTVVGTFKRKDGSSYIRYDDGSYQDL